MTGRREEESMLMDYNTLLSELSALVPVSRKLHDRLALELQHLYLPKDYFLLEPPRASEYIYFLVEGFAMSYTFTRDMKQVEWFWKPSQIILSPRSFFQRLPAQEFIQLTTPGEVLCLSHNATLALLEQHTELNAAYRIVMNKYYDHARERLRDMQFLPAGLRLEKLLKYYPRIEQFVPQECIASYLGITPQSLSRLKRRQKPS